jgi:AcrR family transcriptional regulator
MIEMKKSVLLKAQALFYRYGIRSVSMDDVARLSAISKKTLYEHFHDKNELITAIVQEFIQSNKSVLFNCTRSSDAVEEVLMQVEDSFTKLAEINYSFFYELEKFFPAGWQLLVKYRHRTLLPLIISNLKRGIEEGLFRENIALQFTADIRLQQITTAVNPGDFTEQKYSVHQLMTEFTIFYLHGITTIKGKQLINQYLKTHDEQQSK